MSRKMRWIFEANFSKFVLQPAFIRLGNRPGICSDGFVKTEDGFVCESCGDQFETTHFEFPTWRELYQEAQKKQDYEILLESIQLAQAHRELGSGKLTLRMPDVWPRTLDFPQPPNLKDLEEWTFDDLRVVNMFLNDYEDAPQIDITWGYGKVTYRSLTTFPKELPHVEGQSFEHVGV